eukprot:g14093.t1
MGFSSTSGVVNVRFACPKGFVETEGRVVSDTEVSFLTPNFEKFGPMQVECRLSIGSKGLTNTKVNFQYFSVGDATKTVAFGPGLLHGTAPGVPVVFMIQARDKMGTDRVCGMDEFRVEVINIAEETERLKEAGKAAAKSKEKEGEEEETEVVPSIPCNIQDNMDGTYLVTYTPPCAGDYQVSVEFLGTFQGVAGPICGSPFTSVCEDGSDPGNNSLNGPLLLGSIKDTTKELKDYSTKTLKGLKKNIPKDDRHELIKCKEYLKEAEARREELDLRINANRAALFVLRKKGEKNVDRQLKDFKVRPFWDFECGADAGRKNLGEAEEALGKERKKLDAATHLCTLFEFPDAIKESQQMIADMESNCKLMYKVWDVCEELQTFIQDSKEVLWSEAEDKLCKDFLNTIPLISLLGNKAMRPRHWMMLMKATGKQFIPPYEDPQLKLGGLLALNLHEFSSDVEEIADQAIKEEKMEVTLSQLAERWNNIVWGMDPYKGGDVPLLKIAEEDFEALEADQLVVQGMMASRYLAQFEEVVSSWQTQLSMVRPKAVRLVSGVGSEEVEFEPAIPLEGKVEIYMQVEAAFIDGQKGKKDALIHYNKQQIDQLNDLIRLTQSDLTKGDRTRVMVCITMDAHGRDVVQKMAREGVTMFKAVCDGVKAEAARIVIEGDEVSLDPTCGAYITMNPGYLGRSELPEGLKALFRPMTVMVPDLVLICENMLMAEGFIEAKSVLVVAGAFKRAEPDLAEDALLMRALRDFNIPKIVREDEVVFFGLLGDLFPGQNPPRKVDEELEHFVVKACEVTGNHPDELFCLKVVQLEELLQIRHCVFVMGPPGAGKSQSWKVMRDLGNIPDEKPKWILLDGDLDANWIESMNSVMDDNRMLTLASNERIPLKWISLIQSWLKHREEPQNIKDAFQGFFDEYVGACLLWMKINVTAIVPVEDMALVQVLLYMMDGLLTPANTSTVEELEKVFVFCMIWAMGSALTVSDDGTDYQKLFSDWWRGEWKKVKFPSRETVFDYWLDPETGSFEQWTKSPYFFSIDYDSRVTPMTQITVPTPETCSVTFWMQLLVKMRKPVMMAGPSGTGKTQMVMGMLKMQNPDEITFQSINFNFYTTSAVLQNTMGLPLEKKTGTNFGPPGNSKLVYFLDDLNLSEVDPYNTQSAIALLRQHMEYEHQYDLAKLSLKNIANTQTILDGHLQHFDVEIAGQSSNMIKAALGLHSQVAANFRKTATNFHYEFNIRHLSNVFQGLLVAQPDQFKTAEKFVLLWMHESERVYGDRLVTSLNSMSGILEDALREYNETYATMDLVLFEDAMKHVARIVRIVLNDGGHALLVGVGGSGKQSLSRLAAFICGYSVSQIVISSTYSINDLKEDLKTMYNKAGNKDEGLMFLLTDSQITNERFLIYINDLLASGNIPDLFAVDEVDTIVNNMTSKVKAEGLVPDRKNCWEYFIKLIRKNLHVVLAFSPVGDDFRNRAKKFPALVNCTVIGLQKLRETKDAVTSLEEDLKVKLEDAEQKKTVAEGIAETVSREKAIVEVETAKAQVQAEQVAKTQAEVSIKQRETEADLAKAEPAVAAAMAALDTLNKKDLGECKTMGTPPKGVDDVFAATMVLLAGTSPSVVTTKAGKVKDRSWDASKKQLLGDIGGYIELLKGLKAGVDENTVPAICWKEVRPFLALEHFTVDIIQSKNSAAAGVCSFVLNIVMYYDIVVTVEPKRLALAEANNQLNEANSTLKLVQEQVAELEAKLAKLTAEFNAANSDKQEALDSVSKGQRKLDLAQRLTGALSSENDRWAENVIQLRADMELLTGDVLLAASFISYVGPFTKVFRDQLMGQEFLPFLQKEFQAAVGEGGSLPMSADPDPIKILTTDAEVAGWNSDGLPNDQGIKWIRTKEASPERNLEVVRLGQPDMLRKLEKALENGLFLHTKLSNPHFPPEIQAETTLINFTVTMRGLEDQLLNLVVRKERPDLADLGEQLVEQQNGFKIKMKELEDNILFKLATAEGDITEDVELIEGLEETKRIATDIEARSALAKETQVSIRVTSEKYRPVANRSSLLFFLMNDLVKIHSYYIYSLAAFTKVFYQGIDKVTKVIETPVLPDDEPPDDTEREEKGEGGEDVAGEGRGDGTTEPAEDAPTKEDDELEENGDGEKHEMTDEELAARCVVLVDAVTTTVFNYVRRGLFERDKLTVATMLTLKILVNDGILAQEEVDYLVMSKASMDPGNMGPLGEWLPETIWPKLKSLERIKRFQNIGDAMQSDSDDWQAWFDDEKADQAKLPGEFEKSLNAFDRLILLRAMRPDRVSTALAKWIGQTMGMNYVLQQPYNMAETYVETSPATPMFFVLFPGVDPTPWVESLARTLDITTENGKFINISMGQGQEKPAEGVVERFARDGGWVLLQNCHLMQSWVPSLERLLEIVQQGAHETFRCFISAEPPPMASMKNMPESLMQSCIKVANEAPADIKSNLTRAWANFDQEKIDSCNKPTEYKACLFSLCWFHSIVLGRRRFGPQGWSRPYSFNTGDLTICANVLGSYLNDNPQVPWDDLRYIFGEIMYGGHITDPWDRRTNNVYLEVLFTEGLFKQMELGPGFKAPDPNSYDFQGFLDYTDKELPAESPPQFGLHPNAEIGYLTNSCESLFKAILNIAGTSGGGGGGGDSIIRDTMTDLLERLPENFEMITMQLRAKPLLEGEAGPFVVVALQECSRMNALLSEIRRSLVELDKGLKGQLNMSQSMEDLAIAFGLNEWPGRNPFAQCAWEKLAWPSKKNLLSEFIDMLRRIAQLASWSEELVTPQCLWLPGLFNPTAYLTAVMQVTARSTGSPLDKMTTETHISTFMEPQEVDYYPEDGAFVSGLYIEGARWATGDEAGDTEMVTGTPCAGNLVDSRLKELLPALPVVYVKAVPVQSTWEPSAVGYLRHDPKIYEAPVYITSFRGPTYVFLATLKTQDPVSKWTLTGTAVLLQTDD